MTADNKQERMEAASAGFDKLVYEFRGKAGTAIPFDFAYSGSEKIHCVAGDCSCTKLTANPYTGKILGTLSLSSKTDIINKHGDINELSETRYVRVYFDVNTPLHVINAQTLVMGSNPEKIIATLAIRGFIEV